MSNVYHVEPPTKGKVLLHTTFGDLDIELWADQAPLACRNFLQLCMEGYYDGTVFHRLIKDMMIQGGDPNGDGTGVCVDDDERVYGGGGMERIRREIQSLMDSCLLLLLLW